MGTIGATTAIADRPHRVTLQNPGPAVPDGDGGSTPSWIDMVPVGWSVKIAPATAKDLERLVAGTVLATATHLVTGPFRADVTTNTRIMFGARTFNVAGVADPKERQVETIAICTEIVP